MLFDLDGFKAYNDTFGHPAGDALLARLGAKLAAAVAPLRRGLPARRRRVLRRGRRRRRGRVEEVIAGAAHALSESGEEFSISASYGVVLLPHEADDPRARRCSSPTSACTRTSTGAPARASRRATCSCARCRPSSPTLREHSSEVAELAVAVARRLGMDGEELDEIARAAELHDVGKVGIPDAILDKPGPLDADRVGVHAPAHDPRRADPQRRAGAAPGRADRALDPRALGRHAAIPTACAATRSRWRRASSPSATPTTR